MYGKERCKQIEDNVGSNLPCQPDLETLIRISDLLKVDVNNAVTEAGYGAKVMDSTIASIKAMEKGSQERDHDHKLITETK